MLPQFKLCELKFFPNKKLIPLTTVLLFAALITACNSGLPKEMLKSTREWQQLIENSPTAQSVILVSEYYTMVFNQDGIYNAKADCNVLSKSYEFTGSKLTLFPLLRSSCRCHTGFIQMMVH